MVNTNVLTIKTLEDLDAFKVFYYSHTNKETIERFNFTNETALSRFCKKNNIQPKQNNKPAKSFNEYIANIDKDTFTQDYYNNSNIFEFAEKYNLTIPMLYKILRYYGLKKHQDSISYYIAKVSKQELVDFYITNDNSRKATAIHFNISENVLAKVLNYYEIKKTVSTVAEMQKLISKEELESYYFSHTAEETEVYFNNKYNLAHEHSIRTLIDFYKIDKLNLSKNRILDLVNSTEEKLTIKQIAKKLNLNYCNTAHLISTLNIADRLYLDPQTSNYETEIADFLKSLNIEFEQKNRSILNGHEIDLYIPDKKIGIEFNGNYWHSSAYKTKDYHLNKSKLAREKGVRLIHIWEYEWLDQVIQNKIKLLLKIALGKVDTKIYARQCTIKEISNSDAKVLNNAVHLQGHRNAQVTYGLFYNNELVQLMSFSKTKYNKNLNTDNSWEIIRGCPGSNNIVIGGVSKLFKHFVQDYSPETVFSYCDFNKFDGKSYELLGMTFNGYTGPDMKWLLPNGLVVNRNPKLHAELSKQALFKIFGAGSLKYKIKLK